MNTGAYFRKKFQPVADELGRPFAKLGVNPTLFSSFAIVLAVVGTYFITIGRTELTLVFFTLASLWDLIDGPVARFQNKTSDFGYYIEGIIDKWVEIIMIFGLFLYGYQIESFLLVVTLLMLSFAKPRAAMVTKIGEFDWPSRGTRHERLAVLLLALFIHIFMPELKIQDVRIDVLQIGIILTLLLVSIGHVQRILFAKWIIDAGGVDNIKVEKGSDNI